MNSNQKEECHNCKALIIKCMDFRLTKPIAEFLEEREIMGNCDVVSIAGAAKSIINPNKESEKEFVLKLIDSSQKLHNIDEVWLISHTDCGAYGGSENFNSAEEEKNQYIQDMKQARQEILNNHPELEIKMILAKLSSSGQINFEKINQ